MIEVVVSLALLSLVAGALTGAFTTSLRIFTPGGVQARLAGARDLEFLEQVLGKDGAQATCITAGSSSTVYGQTATTCSSAEGYGHVSACATAPVSAPTALCMAWPVLGSAAPGFLDSTCHVAVYTVQSGVVTRTESAVAYSSSAHAFSTVSTVGSVSVDLYNAVQLVVQSVTAYTPPGESYTWLRALPITLTASGVTAGSFSQTIVLHPVAADPDGSAASITSVNAPSGGDPC